MTRINLIDPGFLTDQHLMAEYRELPMVHAALRRSLKSKYWSKHKIPKDFRLNAGHVMFFYDKGEFLENRYQKLIKELQNRGYSISPEDRQVDFNVFRINGLMGSFCPSKEDVLKSIDRILLRVSQKPDWYRLHRIKIGYENYKNLIEENLNVLTKRQNQP